MKLNIYRFFLNSAYNNNLLWHVYIVGSYGRSANLLNSYVNMLSEDEEWL